MLADLGAGRGGMILERLVSIRSRTFLGFVGVRAVTAIFYVAILVGAHAMPASERHVVMWTTMAWVSP